MPHDYRYGRIEMILFIHGLLQTIDKIISSTNPKQTVSLSGSQFWGLDILHESLCSRFQSTYRSFVSRCYHSM